MNERYELTIERIRAILNEETVDVIYRDYFRKVAEFILEIYGIRERLETKPDSECTLEELETENKSIYSDVTGANYEESYANPVYAVAELGEEIGKLLCFLYAEIRSEIPHVYEKRIEYLTICNELFIEIYNCFEMTPFPSYKELKEIIYWYASDYCDVYVADRVAEQVNPNYTFAKDIILNSDLNDMRYLYQYGEYISGKELKTAASLNALSQEKISEMVGEMETFEKPIVEIRYQIGNERIVRKVMEHLAAKGHEFVVYRAAVNAVTKDGFEKLGYYGGTPNKQYDYDHQADQGLFLNKKFVERKCDVMKNAYEQHKELAKKHAGAIVIEPFKEKKAGLIQKLEAITLRERQEQLLALLEDKTGQLASGYKYL
ncbi:MAG: hypothetical protein IJZ53_13520 [Tyzzerella sp.]|nr:hypothetical protein [Tyzzerella sp.]